MTGGENSAEVGKSADKLDLTSQPSLLQVQQPTSKMCDEREIDKRKTQGKKADTRKSKASHDMKKDEGRQRCSTKAPQMHRSNRHSSIVSHLVQARLVTKLVTTS
jgi:hypothetical protein